MDVSGEELGDAVYLLRKLSGELSDLAHPNSLEAHRSLEAALDYIAALAVELGQHGDHRADMIAALDHGRQPTAR